MLSIKIAKNILLLLVDKQVSQIIAERHGWPTSTNKEIDMLVLSRQKDESIIIGDDIEITIVDVRGDKVRLGINAPREISVHRKEVYEAIQREKAQNQTE